MADDVHILMPVGWSGAVDNGNAQTRGLEVIGKLARDGIRVRVYQEHLPGAIALEPITIVILTAVGVHYGEKLWDAVDEILLEQVKKFTLRFRMGNKEVSTEIDRNAQDAKAKAVKALEELARQVEGGHKGEPE